MSALATDWYSAVPAWFVATALAAVGLVVGSFLNVVIYRVPRGESLLRPGSHCPACDAPVRNRHNVPVFGWLVLRGRCADCGSGISVRYPAVEAATGAAFAALGASFSHSWSLPVLLLLAAVGIALALIDLDVRRLPTAIVAPSYVAATGLLVIAAAASGAWGSFSRALIGSVASILLFYLIRFAWPGGMGGGDVKLAALLGLVTGWLGWGVLVVGVFAGFVLGAVVGVSLMAAGRAGRRSAIPFGPFLIIGAFAAVYLGAPLADMYLNLLNAGA
jgi:leader peptidase (prepilin peptidase)/N-methyltransferase